MKNRILASAFIMLSVMVVFTSCNTEVDLCYEDEHPHRSAAKFEFGWDGVKEGLRPDSMYVIAYRVINQWKASMEVSTATCRGKFVYNGPEQQSSGNADDTGDGTDATPAPQPDDNLEKFSIRAGAYKFYAFNKSNAEFIYDKVAEYMLDETYEKRLQDIYVEYNVYPKGNPLLEMPTIDWQDYNPYAQYMQPDLTPVVFDTIASRNVPDGSVVTCRFSPKPITQHVDIYFSIRKDTRKQKFTVDSVLCDISGIPTRISIANGYLVVDRTAKMMFSTMPDGKSKPEDWKGFDSDNSTKSIKVHGAIDVPGLVQNNAADVNVGPGIMQVFIFTSTEDESGNRVKKKIQGKINLYNTLRNARLLKLTDDGQYAIRNTSKGELNIVADIVIDGNDVLENTDDTGGIDRWIACDENDAPPVIDI